MPCDKSAGTTQCYRGLASSKHMMKFKENEVVAIGEEGPSTRVACRVLLPRLGADPLCLNEARLPRHRILAFFHSLLYFIMNCFVSICQRVVTQKGILILIRVTVRFSNIYSCHVLISGRP